jgi:hypothetical protein
MTSTARLDGAPDTLLRSHVRPTHRMKASRLPPARRSSSTTPSMRWESYPAARPRSPCTCSALHTVAACACIYYLDRLSVRICSSTFGAPDTARSLQTRNGAGRVGYLRKVVAAEMNDAHRLPLLTAYLGNGPQWSHRRHQTVWGVKASRSWNGKTACGGEQDGQHWYW